MPQPLHHYVAREARPVILVLSGLVIAGLVWQGVTLALWLCLPLLLALFVMRDPVCIVPSAPRAVVCPVSGRVTHVRETRDPWLERPAVCIRLQNAIWNVHTLRSPVEGKIMRRMGRSSADALGRRRRAFHLRTDEGEDVVLALAMGVFAPFVRVRLVTGERAGQGVVCGFMYFAGVAEVFLPAGSRGRVSPGESVNSGSTILGELVPRPRAEST